MKLDKLIKESLDDLLKEKGIIQDTKTSDSLNESYVVQPMKFNLNTDLLSSKNKKAHQELLEGYSKQLNEISARLDTAEKDEANLNCSLWRSLKIDESYNHNAVFLHGLFFQNISDVNSQINMDSLSFMRLERDFGSFDNWQEDFIACGLSSRNGWVVTSYNTQLKRYINNVIDLHSSHIMIGSHPVIVLDCWEHSYYRDYLKDRKTYIHGMMKELNWNVIEDRFKVAEKISKVLG